MARRISPLVVLLVALAAAQNVAAHKLGKGKGYVAPVSMGKGDVNVDVQCTQSCNDVCVPVPNKVCNDVPYQTQACQKVPVQQTKQVCERVCTQVYTEQISSGKGYAAPVVMGKGKGRHLMGKDSLIHKHKMMGKMSKGYVVAAGKGHAGAQMVDTNCQDVCKDIPYTTYTTECQTVTKTRTACDIVYQQKCEQVCKPVCQKITTVTTTQSLGKGVAMPVMGKGKMGH